MSVKLFVLIALWAGCLGAVVKKRDGSQPNIMWIFADDYGYNDIGYKDDTIFTPNMDDLAANGIKLNNAYVAAQCTPSRAAFMTGRYVHHLGMQHSVILDGYPQCIPLQYKLLPGYLKDLGYNTHAIGKWHLGMCREECIPQSRGFDTFFGGFSGEGNYWDHMTFMGNYDWQDTDGPCWDCNGTHSQDLIQNRVTDLLEQEDGSKPFFMYVAFHNTHSEALPLEKNMAQYEGLGLDEARQGYLALTSGMDDAIGAIVQQLKDTGHYDNTLIVFSADNGGDVHEANNAPLRGTKSTLWEGGCKGVSWAHSPLITTPGVVSEELIHVTDWLPTFVSIAGGSVDPAAIGLDGVDQSDLVLNNGATQRTHMVYNIDREYSFGPPSYGEMAARNGQYKVIWGNPGQCDGWGYEEADFICNIQQYQDMVADYTASLNSVDKRGGPYYFTNEQMGVYRGWYEMSEVSAEEFEAGTGYIKVFDLLADPEERNDLSGSDDPDVLAAKEELLQYLRDQYNNNYTPQTEQWNAPDPNWDPTVNNGALTPGFCDTTFPVPDNYGQE